MPPVPPPDVSGQTTTTPVPLYWCRYGPDREPRFLVLHGGPGAHHDYLLPQMLQLGKGGGGRTLLFYDQRGGGQSRPPTVDPITWRTQVDDCGAVIREFGLERPAPVIVGYSWGALLAILYAAEAATNNALPKPGLMLLIDPAPVSRAFREQFQAEFARRQASDAIVGFREELAASGLRERDPDAYRKRNFELSVAGYFADPRDAVDLTPFRVTARVQQSVWESLGDFDIIADGRASRIQVPALIVHGRQDPIPLASSQALEQAWGGPVELAILEDCGHVPYVEQPAALFAVLEDYLSRALHGSS